MDWWIDETQPVGDKEELPLFQVGEPVWLDSVGRLITVPPNPDDGPVGFIYNFTISPINANTVKFLVTVQTGSSYIGQSYPYNSGKQVYKSFEWIENTIT